ncbi:protein kinase domain-containing protein [Rhodopirellula sp. JC639]|uniref:protein kinase domain-containing protein n=1 Tax=Stieleria mannarensis TaxID=2755585 RepID=UPI0016021309|nr:protein kinase [Rhodopirellula sp. JC639]
MNECPRCGTELPVRTSDDDCQKCLLQIGLASGTDFSIGELAETLPHRDPPNSATNDASPLAGPRSRTGLSSYQELHAVHDWSGGTVYRAFHEGLQRFVLLRVLESSADDDARRNFLTRAEKLSHLNHPNLPATLEAGIDHDAAFVAEECIDGQPIDGFLPRTKRERWAEGFYPNNELMRVMRDVAAALSAIHGAGLTHDRINPDAIVVDSGGIVRLVGLGESAEATDDRFAEPDQTGGEASAERSVAADLYRFGATFCFLTTGKLPQEIDPELNQRSLTRGLKKSNPGLRTDVCQLISGCVSGRSADDAGHPHRDRPTENPYEATDPNGAEGYLSANDLVDELNRSLQHGVHRNGVWNHTPYIAMELVTGSNLQQHIKEHGALPIATAWDFVTQAAIALRAADRSGVVHRDVKPANLMITDDGKLKVTDFGVSRSVNIDSSNLTMTGSGTIVGTPAYMAPEQAMGKEVDCRSDIYALGMTLYHMLSGHAPFKANSAVEMLAQQMSETPPSLIGRVAGMTQDQAEVLDRMIAKQPAERYSGYDELLDDLNRCAPGVDRLARPVKRIAAELCHWAIGYLFFTLVIFVSFFVRLQGGLNSYDGTTLFGFFMLILFIGSCGIYIIGIARGGVTPGKQILGLRVVRENGQQVGRWRAVLRFAVAYPLFVLYVPRICYYIIARAPGWPVEQSLYGGLLVIQIVAMLASIVMMWMRPDRKTLHDLAAGTIVIRDQK